MKLPSQVRPAEDWRWHLQCIEREMELLRSSGVIEVAARNPSVAEYMKHWEGRTTRAEAKVEAARKILEPMKDCDPDIREWLGLARY